MSNSQKALRAQFRGFLKTPQIWPGNDIFGYHFFRLSLSLPTEFSSEDLPAPETGVLGKRMEHFFKIAVDKYSEEEVIAHNEQVFLEKRTIGELDFLLKHPTTGKITHVELVYKFYLYDPEIPSEEMRWIGPNRKDSLAKKLKRLRQQQFPLLQHPATSELLNKLQLSAEDVSQELCFKACLFLPLDMAGENINNINPEAIQGFWIRANEFTEARFGEAVFHSPKKPDWPILPEENTSWTDFHSILPGIEKMLQDRRSPLLWMRTQKGEFKRFFLVWW